MSDFEEYIRQGEPDKKRKLESLERKRKQQ
jgi:hypothetical protein